MTPLEIADALIAKDRATRVAENEGRLTDGPSAGRSTLAGTVYTAVELPARCHSCRRTQQAMGGDYDGCAHVDCPMRRSLTAKVRDRLGEQK